ncbi:hypothetical protein NGR_c17510 [Sinorhizobium fredii NGR234]|uniref:Uncharacterized protein n=1 Tax=Sinorhizobium fredii (strain NBRC 101917 / NGR234) TaxID=394 RepID=C3MDJ6_SINFN|nr:hypothetical protein NGR_c17510 [Sinorhizobium fredii NGR234]
MNYALQLLVTTGFSASNLPDRGNKRADYEFQFFLI